MRNVERGASIATLYLSLWMATSHGKTVRSFEIRFSETCKGFQIMEDTNIKCILCSTMCLAQLKLEERFHPESHGVLVHSNETQCAQIRMKTDHVFCFEADFVDEETMTLVDTDLNKPIYIGNGKC
ncbi:hypothetical protein TCAL_13168 [Tigriopus californicus]|uniref:Uncharacterized protein n=1 Tax=Tigriopus californicus TaxID=6832 RepID=A0A553PS39_TIGCA|nr:hypothetical protein TCAL_13168 [Tigriopus californicus]